MKPDDTDKIINNPARLEWACRRGMLELDVLLGKFLKEAYPQLSDHDKRLFVALLESTDPELFAWLMGHQTPADTEFARMAEAIRTHARSRI